MGLNLKILCSPNTEDIETWLKKHIDITKKRKILHIVPTLILYRRRLQSYKSTVPNEFYGLKLKEIEQKLRQKYVDLYEMDQFLQELIIKSNLTVLSKRESSIIVERILQQNETTNNLAWKSSIQEITDCFLMLSQTGLNIQEIRNLDQTPSWQTICDLYETYLNELIKQNVLDFGQASIKLLQEHDFRDFEMLILDGAFLPILSKHHLLIDRFNALNKPIVCFLPVDLDVKDHPAFEAIKTTYQNYVAFSKWQSIKSEEKKHNVVEKLSSSIFHSKIDEVDDLSVQIVRFTSAEEELDRIVERAAQLIHHKMTTANKIAIVTPNPMELRPIVRELSEIYGLVVEAPDRPLIQLPHGRGINNLFKIYTDDRLEAFNIDHIFDVNIFTELLHSKLIKNSESLIEPFEKLKVFFEDCQSFADWYFTIEQLINAKEQLTENFSYHPLFYIDKQTLIHLKETIEIIEKVSSDLISDKETTFQDHMTHMISYIKNSPFINDLDSEIESRLLKITNQLSLHRQLTINRVEFARRIHAILTDKGFELEENIQKQLDKILVTGPNNIEFQEYDYIFLARFTQNMYPDVVNYKWPITSTIERKILNQTTKQHFPNDTSLIHYYLDRSMYYFYIVLNAAKKNLTITYSKFENGIELTPSHYLNDIAETFGIEESENSKETIEDLLIKAGLLFEGSIIPHNIKISQKLPQIKPLDENEIITIEDIAIYEFCPRRFYYEKTLSHERVYSTIFHIQNFAISCLHEEAITKLVEKFPTISADDLNRIERTIPTIIDEAESKIKVFFPIGQRFWEDVKIKTKVHLLNLIERILSQTDHKYANLSLKTQSHQIKIGPYTFYGERQLQVNYPTSTHYYAIKNMKKILSFHTNEHWDEQKRLKEIKNNYFNLLSNFCRKESVAESSLHYYAEKIALSDFPKRTGAHCNYCVFQNACREKEIHENEVD